jgi:hypothetical protein
MTVVYNPKDQWIQIIEDYLTIAKACIEAKADESIPNGYSATLLLLCAIDSIGHGLLHIDNGQSCRLDVLIQPPFDPKLNISSLQVKNLTDFFRNGLAHVGVMAPNVFLSPEQGNPFAFDQNAMLTGISVPSLYGIVKAAWDNRNRSTFNAQLRPAVLQESKRIAHLPGYVSSLSPGASGQVRL